MVIDPPSPELEPQLLELWKQTFGAHDGFWEMFLRSGYSPDRCRCILEDGTITAALCWFDCFCAGQKFAYLYAVVTHPDHRGRGLCRSLMEDTHAHLKELPYDGVLLVPAEESLRGMYRKMGYRNATTVREYACSAGENTASIRLVTPAEYAALRRKMLPPGGVIQEGENLSFLAAQAELLAGNNILLAAWRENDTLHAMELLGNPEAAPGIVKALGCQKGTFRTPGDDISFAMGLKLQKNTVFPTYFGFAFD